MLDHVIEGRPLYPFTGYLVLAWKTLCKLLGLDYQNTPIVIDNFYVYRATIMTKAGRHLTCLVHRCVRGTCYMP